MTPEHQGIPGAWVAGEHEGQVASATYVLDGALFSTTGSGSTLIGAPDDFLGEGGETGAALVELLIPAPSLSALRRGAVRETLANACSIARIGRNESRIWDTRDRYLVDNGEGERGAVRFIGDACVGAVWGKAPFRKIDYSSAASRAPHDLRGALLELCELPFFRFLDEGQLISVVFWAEGGRIVGPERWSDTYIFGVELFEAELGDGFGEDAEEFYSLSRKELDLIEEISHRGSVSHWPIPVLRSELATLIPPDAPHHEEACSEILDGGAFELRDG